MDDALPSLAVRRDAGRRRRRRRPFDPAGRRRASVRQGRRELTDERDRAADREARERAIAYLDLQENRGPVETAQDDEIERILRATRRIAVVGASSNEGRPSFAVFRYLIHEGFECVPVNPNERSILGIPSFPNLAEAVAASGPFDMIDVFRRSELVVPHAREAVAAGAACLWLQLGVVNWDAARIASEAGLSVVMDRCTAIEWRRLARG